MNNLNIEDWDAHGDSGKKTASKYTHKKIRNSSKKKGRKRGRNIAWPVFLCIVALTALSGCLYLIMNNYKLKNEVAEATAYIDEMNSIVTYTQEEADNMVEEASTAAARKSEDDLLQTVRTMMESGDGTSAMLRSLYPEKLVVASDNRYYFMPILDTIKHHSYEIDQFKLNDNNVLEYFENDEVVSKKGIDVSKYQKKINWKSVASDGVEYAFIRLGIRGSSEGKIILDDTYEDNIEGALANKIDVGVYFFTQALNKKEAIEDAEFVLDNIKDYDVNYPIVLDVEEITTKNPRTKDMTMQDWTDVCIAFCDTIKAAGYTPMIYGNLKTFLLMVDIEQLEAYEKWFAYYQNPLYFPYEFSIWQYTATGKVKGISGDVDLNVSMKDWNNE